MSRGAEILQVIAVAAEFDPKHAARAFGCVSVAAMNEPSDVGGEVSCGMAPRPLAC
jgi:hypothetical protein